MKKYLFWLGFRLTDGQPELACRDLATGVIERIAVSNEEMRGWKGEMVPW